MQELYDEVRRLRAEDAADDVRAAKVRSEDFRYVVNRLVKDIERVVNLREKSKEKGTGDEDLAAQELEVRRHLKLVERELSAHAAAIGDEITDAQKIRVGKAVKEGKQLAAVQMVEPAQRKLKFGELDPKYLEGLIGKTATGGAVDVALGKLGENTTGELRHRLLVGLAAGMSPRDLVEQEKATLGAHEHKFLTIAHTAEMQAFQAAQHHFYLQNADLFSGWRWIADFSPHICPACLSKHGHVFSLHVDMYRHYFCYCKSVPVLRDPERKKDEFEKGQDWLAQQPESVQRQILGGPKWEAWDKGEISLEDCSVERDQGEWGNMHMEGTLAEALENAKARREAESKPKPPPAKEPRNAEGVLIAGELGGKANLILGTEEDRVVKIEGEEVKAKWVDPHAIVNGKPRIKQSRTRDFTYAAHPVYPPVLIELAGDRDGKDGDFARSNAALRKLGFTGPDVQSSNTPDYYTWEHHVFGVQIAGKRRLIAVMVLVRTSVHARYSHTGSFKLGEIILKELKEKYGDLVEEVENHDA